MNTRRLVKFAVYENFCKRFRETKYFLSSRLHSLRHKLFGPLLDTAFGEIVFICGIERKAEKLSFAERLGVGKIVSFRRRIADHICASSCESVVQFFNRVTKVLTIPARVSKTKDGDWFAIKIEFADIIKLIIPVGHTAHIISSGVPGRGTDDESIKPRKVGDISR